MIFFLAFRDANGKQYTSTGKTLVAYDYYYLLEWCAVFTWTASRRKRLSRQGKPYSL